MVKKFPATSSAETTKQQPKKRNTSSLAVSRSTSKIQSMMGEETTSKVGSEVFSDADVFLKADHLKVEKLFQQYDSAEDEEEKQSLSNQICRELIVHTLLEEKLFYPACREAGVEDDMLDEAQVEHDGAKVLITQLITLPASSAYYDAKMKVLCEYVKHHVGEEEKSSDGIFAKARSAGVNMTALGERLQSYKDELLAQREGRILQPPIPCSLAIPQFINRFFKEKHIMANYQNRDDQGRYTSEGNRNSSRGRSASNEQYDDEDRYRGRSSSQGNHDRDEYGRFISDDDQRFGGSYGRDQNDDYGRSNRNYNDYDDNYSSGRQSRGQGQGWHSDSEGHSDAARRGHQSYSQSRGGYDNRDQNEYGRSGRNYNDYDDNSMIGKPLV